MDEPRTDLAFTHETPPRTSNARRLSLWLLIIAAVMFAIVAVGYLGFDLRVWFAPATATKAAQMEWHGEVLSFSVWRNDPSGSLLVAITCTICISLLLLSAWGVRRHARWAAILGIVVSLPLGAMLVFVPIMTAIELIRGAWTVFHGGHDGIGLGVLEHSWTFCIGLTLLFAVTRLWSVFREAPMAYSSKSTTTSSP